MSRVLAHALACGGRAPALQELIAMTIMATAALLLFEQGAYMDGPARSAWPPQAALLVGACD